MFRRAPTAVVVAAEAKDSAAAGKAFPFHVLVLIDHGAVDVVFDLSVEGGPIRRAHGQVLEADVKRGGDRGDD